MNAENYMKTANSSPLRQRPRGTVWNGIREVSSTHNQCFVCFLASFGTSSRPEFTSKFQSLHDIFGCSKYHRISNSTNCYGSLKLTLTKPVGWPSRSIIVVYSRIFLKQNRSTQGCSKLKRSVDMTSSGKNGLNIRTNSSPKWDRTRCPEE